MSPHNKERWTIYLTLFLMLNTGEGRVKYIDKGVQDDGRRHLHICSLYIFLCICIFLASPICTTGKTPLKEMPSLYMTKDHTDSRGIGRVSSRILQLGGWSSISATVQPPSLHEVWGGGGLCQYWLDWTSGERGPSHHALRTKYIIENRNRCPKSSALWPTSGEEPPRILQRGGGGTMLDHLRCALGTLHSQKIWNFSNQSAFWWDLKDFYKCFEN